MVITYLTEKGGVGKTSLCFNAGYYIASLGKKILFIDLDGQRANLSYFVGVKNRDDATTMKQVLIDGVDPLSAIVKTTHPNIDIIVGNSTLIEVDKHTKIQAMMAAINKLKTQYDFIFIDVNPTPSRLHVLSLSASDFVVIPMLADIASLEANKGIAETYQLVKESINKDIRILGLVFNKYNSRTTLSKEVTETAEKMAQQLQTSVFNTKIRNNKALSENVAAHIGATEYDSKSAGAQDIIAFTSELLLKI